MDAVIVAATTTRFGMFTDTPLRDLAADATDRALGESGVNPSDIGLVVFGNAAAGVLTGQEMIRAQTSLASSRLAGRPMISVENAAASAELIIAEELGLAAQGDGAKLVRSGASDLGGRCPVKPSGGLLARGHAIGATGVAQLVELADQLWGRAGDRQVEGARVALAENAGGELGNGPAACVVTILQAP